MAREGTRVQRASRTLPVRWHSQPEERVLVVDAATAEEAKLAFWACVVALRNRSEGRPFDREALGGKVLGPTP